MKRFFFISTAFVALIVCFQSCKKEERLKSVVGFWTGKYSTAAGSEWSWLLKADNTIRVYIGTDTATASPKMDGTYSVTSDSTINVRYQQTGGLPIALNNCKINANYTRIEGSDFVGTRVYVER